MAAFAIVCLATYYVLNGNSDMEWLRTRIEATLNERAKGDLTVQLASAKIAVEKGEGAHLLMSGLSIKDQSGRFVASSDRIKIVPAWLSLFSDEISIKQVSLDGADIKYVSSGRSMFPDFDQQSEVLLTDLYGQKSEALEASNLANVLQTFLNFDSGEDQPEDVSIENEGNTASLELDTGLDASFAKNTPIEDDKDVATAEADEPEVLQLLANNMNAVGHLFDRIHQLGLGKLDIRNVSLNLLDEGQHPRRKIKITSAIYSESVDESAARAQQHISVKTQQHDKDGVEVTVTHVRQNIGTGRAFLINASNIIASNFVAKLRDPNYPIKIGVPFGLNGQLVLDDHAAISRLNFKVNAGEGVIETGPNAIFNVDSGLLDFTLSRRSRQLILKPSQFLFGKNKLVVKGNLGLPKALLQPYKFQLFSNDIYLDTPGANAPPLSLDMVQARGALQPARKLISISEFTVQKDDVRGDAAVSFGFDGKTPSMALVANIDEAPVSMLKQVWPIFIAPSARSWTLNNLHSGVLKNATITTAIPTGILGNLRKGANLKDNEMVADFDLEKASFRAFGDFPDVEDADLHGKIRGISFAASLQRGKAVSKYGGAVALDKGRFKITDFRFPEPKADISLIAKGTASDVGEIANREPVRALTYAAIEPKNLAGRVLAEIALSLPLKQNLKANEVTWKAGLDIEKFTSPKPIDGRKIESASADIEIDPNVMTIEGKGKIDGIQADIDIKVPISGSQKARTVAVKVVLTEKDRKKLGIDFGEFLKGPVSLEIDQNASSAKQGDLYKVDLSRAEINLDFVGWKKARGVAATARMRLITNAKGTLVRGFSLAGDGFNAKGDIDITNSGDIKRLKLSKLSLKKGDNISVDAVLRSGPTYHINVDGTSFDARSLIHTLTERPNDAADKRYRYKIKASIGSVTGYIAEKIRGLSLDVSLRGATVLKLAVSGLTKNAGKPFQIRYGAVSGRGDVLTASGPDGGAIARFANIYYRAFGGPFAITGIRPPGTKALTGNFRMNRFWLVDEPALKGLGGATKRNGKPEVKFNILNVDFTEQDLKLRVVKGLLSGDNIGGTYEGVLNRKTKRINFTGTYVPIYVLNNFFTKIPLVGQVLGNGKREGLIGVTFKVNGTLGKPIVRINPLSALAPGFLRQLFRFRKTNQQTN